MFMWKFVSVLSFFVVVVSSVDDAITNPCVDDVVNVCGMPFPDTYQQIFNARMCLRSNVDILNPKCQDYLNIVSPSIIEPCFDEIVKFCKNVEPGNNRIHICLAKYPNNLSFECTVALTRVESFDQASVAIYDESKYDSISGDENHLRASVMKSLKDISKIQGIFFGLTSREIPNYMLLLFEDLYAKMDSFEASLQEILNEFVLGDDALNEYNSFPVDDDKTLPSDSVETRIKLRRSK